MKIPPLETTVPETPILPRTNWFKRNENIAAIVLTLLVLGLHFLVINHPHRGATLDSQGKVVTASHFNPSYHYFGEILDEQHYVTEANSIIHDHKLLHPEHPSLGKLWISAGIRLFGDNSFGWRFFPVMFGTASIILFYLICQKLTSRRYIPLIATFLFAFENSVFVQAGVAMLDVFLVTFMLAAFLLYLHNRYIASGVALALASLVKFSAASAGIVIILHWIYTRIRARQACSKTSVDSGKDLAEPSRGIAPAEIPFSLPPTVPNNSFKNKLISFLTGPNRNGILFLISAPIAFFALMPLADWLATNHFLNPWTRVHQMITLMSSLTFANTHAGNASRPWDWVISPEGMAFWFTPHYTSGVNWTMWALIIPSILYAIWGSIKRNALLLFSILWFSGAYLVWFPVYFLTDRIMFRFYFYPTVGAICLALAFAIDRILALAGRQNSRKVRWTLRSLMGGWMIANLVIFAIMSPLT